jgi:hypothetical protein
MKTHRKIYFCLAVLAGTASAARSEDFRTDINPALRYYLALLEEPKQEQRDRDYLFANEWRGRTLDKRFGDLLTAYNNEFKAIRQAGQAKVPCEWGIDYSAGPYTLLPGLARWKGIAQLARLRTLWDLQNGRPTDARDDLVAVMALAHNVSRDSNLIARLVEIAMESILCTAVAENYGRFSTETLQQLVQGFDSGPARGTLAESLPGERASTCEWLIGQITKLQRENPGNDAPALHVISELLDESGEGEGPEVKHDRAAQIIKAAGGTSEGILKFLRDLLPLYDKMQAMMALPREEFESRAKEFDDEIRQSPNPFGHELLPSIRRSRTREFAVQAKLAMVRAAVEYKSRGEAGLNDFHDPFGTGPFAYHRVVVDGVDRGFSLSSAYNGGGFQETLAFVEKDGPALYIDGKNAGRLLPQQAIK